ncbi:Metallo-dependent phosphatase [Microthyrium microscopicum]|uniref:Metallo-dependent phosphatase n=1 Tax=Microthyrium microscopicum TaxID=703497 RepID=A0A6A6TY74_9PEZI|nr:Metallo-dependent phosphatase [Microthyrium microscopicum]
MTRLLFRSGLQLALFTGLIFFLIYFVDSRYRVLPSTIHNHLPAHHPGLVVTDITVNICRVGKCKLDESKWHRIDKDLYLKSGWLSKAYVHIQRKKEEDLSHDDKVVVDVRVGRLDPSTGEKGDAAEKWETRPGGIWLKRSSGRHVSDTDKAVTSVDVLFGADAVDPRPNWQVRDQGLRLDYSKESLEARLTIRRGQPAKIERPTVRVGKDGKFKIMQASDLHMSTGLGVCRDPEPAGYNNGKCEADPRTLEFVARLLDEEKPDLVILSGDQVNGETAPDSQSAIFKLLELFTSRKIPYAAIMGNHDDEGSLSRAEMVDLISEMPYSLTTSGPPTLPGSGNYYLQVMSHNGHHSALTIWLFDTHSYSPDEKKYHGYDWIKDEQIRWFKDVAGGLKSSNAKYSHIHLDMAFIHIPIPEYRDAGMMVGDRKEGVTAPLYNSNFYDALIDMKIPVVSCGHDHANDYCLFPDKQKAILEGVTATSPAAEGTSPNKKDFDKIWMCYAGGAGFGGYGGYGGYHRRIRFFELDANEARITTYKRLEYGETKKRLDEHAIVDQGRVVVPDMKSLEPKEGTSAS